VLSFFKRKKAKKFGEIAVSRGFVTEKDMRDALLAQAEYLEKHKVQKEIGAILSEKGVLSPHDLKAIIDEQSKGPSGPIAWFTALFGLSR
jgi:hypothetical protein